MLQIDNKIISLDIIEKKFHCDLSKCKGVCCLYGEAGAPITLEEIKELEKNYSSIKEFLPKRNIKAIKAIGIHYKDIEGDTVTTLVGERECAYSHMQDGIYYCGIEKAYLMGKSSFRKPISCHLYPMRVKINKEYEAWNYDEWKVCSPACALGKKNNIYVFEFLKEAIIRKAGKEFYEKLDKTAKAYLKEKRIISVSKKT